MIVQLVKHKCVENKRVEIETTRIDGKYTGWQMTIHAYGQNDWQGHLELRMYVDYCPFCGKELAEEELK